MRVGMGGLMLWSFLMASAHGAGLMVVPIVLGAAMQAHCAAPNIGTPMASLAATAVHAAGYLVVTAVISIIVYQKLGLGLLRRAWFNLDLLWAVALIGTAVLTIAL